jgi:hypothetical protein
MKKLIYALILFGSSVSFSSTMYAKTVLVQAYDSTPFHCPWGVLTNSVDSHRIRSCGNDLFKMESPDNESSVPYYFYAMNYALSCHFNLTRAGDSFQVTNDFCKAQHVKVTYEENQLNIHTDELK